MVVNLLRVHVVQSCSSPGHEFQYTKCDFSPKKLHAHISYVMKNQEKKNGLEPSEHFVL